MLLLKTIKWLIAFLTWKEVGFENEHPSFFTTTTHWAHVTEETRGLPARDARLMEETQPLPPAAPCLMHLLP